MGTLKFKFCFDFWFHFFHCFVKVRHFHILHKMEICSNGVSTNTFFGIGFSLENIIGLIGFEAEPFSAKYFFCFVMVFTFWQFLIVLIIFDLVRHETEIVMGCQPICIFFGIGFSLGKHHWFDRGDLALQNIYFLFCYGIELLTIFDSFDHFRPDTTRCDINWPFLIVAIHTRFVSNR